MRTEGQDSRLQSYLYDAASGIAIADNGSPIGRHINSGNTILPQGSPRGRHTQSPLGQGSLNKSPLAGE